MITFTFAGDEAGDVSLNFEKGASRYFVPAFIATQSPDSLCAYNSETRDVNNLVSRAQEKSHARGTER